MADNMTNDDTGAAEIERDVERTQDQMGDTVQQIESKLNPRNIARSVLGDQHADTAQDAWQVVRQSPVPVALIAVGTAWLFATSDAPLVSRIRDDLKSRIKGATGSGGSPRLRPRSEEPAPIGPPPAVGEDLDRRAAAATDAL
jgi:hypothetical protein